MSPFVTPFVTNSVFRLAVAFACAIAGVLTFATTTTAAEPLFPGAPEEAGQFGFFIGDWDCQWTGYNAEGEAQEPLDCFWSARYTFDKHMVQDDFTLYDKEDNVIYTGTTLRTYAPQLKRWEFAFLGSQGPAWPAFHGRWENGEMRIHAENTDAKGRLFISRIKFYEIQSDSIRWHGERSYDDGKTWTSFGDIRATRQR